MASPLVEIFLHSFHTAMPFCVLIALIALCTFISHKNGFYKKWLMTDWKKSYKMRWRKFCLRHVMELEEAVSVCGCLKQPIHRFPLGFTLASLHLSTIAQDAYWANGTQWPQAASALFTSSTVSYMHFQKRFSYDSTDTGEISKYQAM